MADFYLYYWAWNGEPIDEDPAANHTLRIQRDNDALFEPTEDPEKVDATYAKGKYKIKLIGDEKIGNEFVVVGVSSTSGVEIVGIPVGLHFSIIQQIARIQHNRGGTNAVHFVSTAGSDAKDGLTPAGAKLSPKTTIEAATAGDFVVIGPGTYALGNNVINTPDGVSWSGAGIDKTIITSSAGANEGCIVRPPSNGAISDYTIKGTLTDDFQFPIGAYQLYSGQASFQNAIIERIKTESITDGLYINTSSTCSVIVRNCQFYSQYDAVNLIWGSHVVEIHDTILFTEGPCDIEYNQESRGACNYSGTLNLFRCDIYAADGESTTSGITCYSHGLTKAYDCVIKANSDGVKYFAYVEAESTGEIVLNNCFFSGESNGNVTVIDSPIKSVVASSILATPSNKLATGSLGEVTTDTASREAITGTDGDTLKTLSDQLDLIPTIGEGSVTWTINVSVGGSPIDGAEVRITTDEEGTNPVAGPIYTNASGNVSPLLDPGTYYLWVQASGYNFTNPTEITVTA